MQALALGGWGNVDILLSAVLQPIPLSPPPLSPAAASVHLPDPLLDEAVAQLQAQLSAPKGQLRADVVRIYVQAVGQVR